MRGPSTEGTRRRLVVLASTYPAAADDGTPAFVRDLASHEAREFDTVVLVPRVPGAPAVERVDGLVVRRFGYFPRRWEGLADGAILENLRRRRTAWLQVLPFLAAEALALRRAVRTHRPDVLHVHWVIPQGIAALLAGRRVPWLVTTLGGDVYGLSDPVSRLVKRAVLSRAGAVTAMNSEMAERLLDLGAPATQVQVLPMGADVTGVRDGGAGVEREPGRILFVGRLVEKKGLAVLLAALRRMGVEGWTLDVVGDGPLRAELAAAAAGLPVRFHGALSRRELAVEYAKAEITVVPSVAASSGDQDGLPVALLEAMAAGCAVVGSRISGIDAALVDGVSGVLVPPGDVAALAGAVSGLLAEPEQRAKLGAEARSRAEEFSVASVGDRYCALLHEIAAPRRRPVRPLPAGPHRFGAGTASNADRGAE